MRIGIVTTWFERGAAYVSRQFERALAQDNEVFIYARGGERGILDDPTWDRPNVHWSPWLVNIPLPTPIIRSDFLAWLQRERIEIVLFNEQQWWPPVLWCRELGIKTGAYVDYYTRDTVPFFAAYDFLICNTRQHLRAFEWHPDVIYAPWGTETDIFVPQCEGPTHAGMVTFFHSSGVSPHRKGTDLVLQAFARVDGPGRLIVHSQTSLAGLLPKLGDLISKLEAQGRLSLEVGTVGRPGFYHRGDVYVYPSRLDGIGLTVAEALSCGLPAIVTDSGPMNEFIDRDFCRAVPVERSYPREDGYYWPQTEVGVEALAAAMRYYVENIASVTEMKRKARQFARQRLDWMTNSAQLSREIAAIANKPRTSTDTSLARRIKDFEATRQSAVVSFALRFPRTYERAYRAAKGLRDALIVSRRQLA